MSAEQFVALTQGSLGISSRRDVITAVGPDTLSFLQGQLSQDLQAMSNGESRLTLHLQPNGRLIGLARLTRVDDETVLLDTELGVGERIRAGLARFLIRTKCVLTIEEAVPSLSWPNAPAGILEQRLFGVELPLIVSSVPFYDGVDMIGTDRLAIDTAMVPSVDADVAEAFRIEHGVPRDGAEFTDTTLPSETAIIDHAVTFGKGCYVGQELVERIDSRGRVVRSLRRLESLEAAPGVPDGAGTLDVFAATDVFAANDVVGHTTSLAVHPVTGKFVGIALIKSSAPADGLRVTLNGCEVTFRLVS